MGFRTAGIEKPIIIQIDGETHVCPTIHKIFTKGLGLPHTIRLGSGPRMNQGRAKGCVSCFRHDVWQNSEAGHARHRPESERGKSCEFSAISCGSFLVGWPSQSDGHWWWIPLILQVHLHRHSIILWPLGIRHLHHRHSARHSSVQDGQACALAVRRGNRQPVDSKYYKAAKATLDEAITDVNNWIDQQAAKAE